MDLSMTTDVLSVSIDDGPPVPCDLEVGTLAGLKHMTITALAELHDRVGRWVDVRLEGGGRAAVGVGLVTCVDSVGGPHCVTTIHVDAPMRMLPAPDAPPLATQVT